MEKTKLSPPPAPPNRIFDRPPCGYQRETPESIEKRNNYKNFMDKWRKDMTLVWDGE